MTITEYLQNPYGKGSAIAAGALQGAKETMMTELLELEGRFACRAYICQGRAILHVVVPSKKKPNISYDVLFEVHLNDIPSTEVTIENSSIKVFSNCPSFIFTYAHAFEEKGLTIKWLENKYRSEVRKNLAVVKNASNVIGLERSLYLACLYLRRLHYTDVGTIKTIGNKVGSVSQIALQVRSQDQVMQAVKAKVEKKDETKPPKGSPSGPLTGKKSGATRTAAAKAISRTPDVKASAKTGSSLKSSKAKKTKRI